MKLYGCGIMQFYFPLVSILLSCVDLSHGQSEEPRPTFPDVFQVELQGVFYSGEKVEEIDGALYYDRANNTASVSYTFQGEDVTLIYNFNNDEMLTIQGYKCEVSNIPDNKDESFFPFTRENNKKVIASPEEILYFSKSVLNPEEMTVMPVNIYTANMSFPLYNQKDCNVMHIFSKPEVVIPDCDSNTCRSTLMTISVKCQNEAGEEVVKHTYNFFRFRPEIRDTGVFQMPVGVFCNATRTKPFPSLPSYFSFSYSMAYVTAQELHNPSPELDIPAFTVSRKIWYDGSLRLVRTDEYDDDEWMMSSRIFDFYGGVAYTIVSSIPTCQPSPLKEEDGLDEITLLPRIFFEKNPLMDETVYVGKRNVHNINYEVWSLSYFDDKTDANVVEEFYFLKVSLKVEYDKTRLLLSHVEIFTYEKDDDGDLFELSMVTLMSVHNYQTKPKAWDAFDISSCFEHDQRLEFRLKIEGPPIAKNSLYYEELLVIGSSIRSRVNHAIRSHRMVDRLVFFNTTIGHAYGLQ